MTDSGEAGPYLHLCKRVIGHIDAFIYLGNQWSNASVAKKEVSQLGMMLSMHPAMAGRSSPSAKQEFLAGWAAAALQVSLREGDLIVRQLATDLIKWSLSEDLGRQRLTEIREVLCKLRESALPAKRNPLRRLTRKT